MNFDKKMINIRKENNLTQEDLAEKLNVSRQTISNWENGKCYPDIETLVIISNHFNISLDDLLKSDEKLVKNILKKAKINKLIKKIIMISVIISIILAILIFKKNYNINKITNENNELKNEILYYTNIPENYSIITFSKDEINTNNVISHDIYADLYINDLYTYGPLVTSVKIFNNNGYIRAIVPDEIYYTIEKAKHYKYTFVLQENYSNDKNNINYQLIDYFNKKSQ